MLRIHLIAIGGSAMHSLAIELFRLGHNVSGSDDLIFDPAKKNRKIKELESNLASAHLLIKSLRNDKKKLEKEMQGLYGIQAKVDTQMTWKSIEFHKMEQDLANKHNRSIHELNRRMSLFSMSQNSDTTRPLTGRSHSNKPNKNNKNKKRHSITSGSKSKSKIKNRNKSKNKNKNVKNEHKKASARTSVPPNMYRDTRETKEKDKEKEKNRHKRKSRGNKEKNKDKDKDKDNDINDDKRDDEESGEDSDLENAFNIALNFVNFDGNDDGDNNTQAEVVSKKEKEKEKEKNKKKKKPKGIESMKNDLQSKTKEELLETVIALLPRNEELGQNNESRKFVGHETSTGNVRMDFVDFIGDSRSQVESQFTQKEIDTLREQLTEKETLVNNLENSKCKIGNEILKLQKLYSNYSSNYISSDITSRIVNNSNCNYNEIGMEVNESSWKKHNKHESVTSLHSKQSDADSIRSRQSSIVESNSISTSDDHDHDHELGEQEQAKILNECGEKYIQLQNELIEIKLINQRLNAQLKIGNTKQKARLKVKQRVRSKYNKKEKYKEIVNETTTETEIESEVETESEMDDSYFDEMLISLMQTTDKNNNDVSDAHDVDIDDTDGGGDDFSDHSGSVPVNRTHKLQNRVPDVEGGCCDNGWTCGFGCDKLWPDDKYGYHLQLQQETSNSGQELMRSGDGGGDASSYHHPNE